MREFTIAISEMVNAMRSVKLEKVTFLDAQSTSFYCVDKFLLVSFVKNYSL